MNQLQIRCTWRMILLGILLAAAANCGITGPQKEQENTIRFSADGSLSYGRVHGYMQIPKGGEAGSTSKHRPTLNELDMDYTLMKHVSLEAGWGNHNFYGGGRFIRLHGSSVLGRTLISQEQTFPAGTAVSADVQLDWYRAGYQYRFQFEPWGGHLFTLAPSIEVVYFDYVYELDGSNGASAERRFDPLEPRLGLETVLDFDGPFSLSAEIATSSPFSNEPYMLSMAVMGKVQLWNRSRSNGNLYLGLGFDRIEFEDSQSMPNKIEVDIGPYVLFGFTIGF